MELEELKRLWEKNDAKLEQSLRLNTRLLKTALLEKVDASTRWLSRWLVLELLLNLVAPVCLGVFIGNHFDEARFLVPAAVLQLCAIGLIVRLASEIVAIHRVDYGLPVVEIQKRLESLRVERARTTIWTLLAAPLLWTPLLVVGMRALIGVDAYAALGALYLAANVLVGILFLGLALWISRRYADRMGRSPFLQRLMRSLSGRSLAKATELLGAVTRFENEEAVGEGW